MYSPPQFLADIICEQPLTMNKKSKDLLYMKFPNMVFSDFGGNFPFFGGEGGGLIEKLRILVTQNG